MNYKRDTFISDLLSTIQFVLFVTAVIVVRAKGFVEMPLILYIIICVLLVIINLMTYLPLYTGFFIVLKLMERLTLGWGWIAVTIILDIICAISVPAIRNSVK